MGPLKKLDEGLARGEGAIAAVVLLSMIVVASVQALFRNLTYLELSWANDALSSIDWADQFLKRGTLWLAFLGASLATRDERHIAIDVLPKLLSDRGKLLIKGLVGISAGVIAFYLARAFWGAVQVTGLERPVAYEVFGDAGAVHVCDATAANLADARMTAPGFFCGVRGFLAAIGAPVETPAAALQLVVPAAFGLMALRLVGHGIGAFMDLAKPPAPAKPTTAGRAEAGPDERASPEPETGEKGEG